MNRFAISAMAASAVAFGLTRGLIQAEEPKQVRARVFKIDEDGARVEVDGDKDISVIVTGDKKDQKPVTRMVRRIHADHAGTVGTKETYLGVVTEPVPAVLAAQLPKMLSKDQGLVVGKALDKSPAAKSGLRANDVIATFGDQKLFNSEQLKKLVCAEKPGAKVDLGVIREGGMLHLSATLEERPVSAFVTAIAGMGGDGIADWTSPGKENIQRRVEVIRKEAVDKALATADKARTEAHKIHAEAIAIARDAEGSARKEAEVAHRAAADAHRQALIQYHKALELHKEKDKAKTDGKPGKSIAISITVDSNSQPKISVEFTDENGKPIKKSFTGKLEDLHEQFKDLPSDLRERLHESLKNLQIDGKKINVKAGVGGKDKSGVKTEVRADVINLLGDDMKLLKPADGKGAFQFRIGKPDGTATIKSFDFDIDIDTKDIMKQLGDLGPETKAQIEKALKGVKIPKVDVSVEKSQ